MIKKGLKVQILTGKDKKKEGEIIEIDRRNNRAKVKEINMVKKHVKTTKEKKGGIISKESFIHISNLKLIGEKNSSLNNPYCPITLGVSFLDQINVLENLKKIEFKNVAYPIIFISFISRSSEIIGKKIYVKIDEKKMLLNLNVNISSNFIEQEFPKIANRIEVNFLENKDNFTDDEWKNLYKLSEDTFVEERDSLKEGAAGAGLTDND